MAKLTKAQRFALENASMVPATTGHPTMKTAEQLGSSPSVCGTLAAKGLLEVARQSEQYRGERRTYWSIYRITLAGRAALQEEEKR